MDEIFDCLRKATFYLKLDFKAGFHKIRVKNEDVEKTDLNTKFGHYEFLVMPVGLCNALATSKLLMNAIFGMSLTYYMLFILRI